MILFSRELHRVWLTCSSFGYLTHLLENNVSQLGSFWQPQQVLGNDVYISPVLDELNINESVSVVAVFEVDELQLLPAFVLLQFETLVNVSVEVIPATLDGVDAPHDPLYFKLQRKQQNDKHELEHRLRGSKKDRHRFEVLIHDLKEAKRQHTESYH